MRIAAAVARRPHLWTTALRQVRRTAAPGWWRRWPYLPLPASDYLRFRTVTQYGSDRHVVDAGDVLNYLTWCRQVAR